MQAEGKKTFRHPSPHPPATDGGLGELPERREKEERGCRGEEGKLLRLEKPVRERGFSPSPKKRFHKWQFIANQNIRSKGLRPLHKGVRYENINQ